MKNILAVLFILGILLITLTSCNLQNNSLNSSKLQNNETKEALIKTTEPHQSNKPTIILPQNTATPSSIQPNILNSTTRPEATKADNFYIEEIVTTYERLFISGAINNNDFNAVKRLLIPDSYLSKSQEKLAADFNKQGITEKLVNFEIKDIKKSGNENEFYVYIIVNIEITDPKNGIETKEFKRIYTVSDDSKNRKITNIDLWK